MYVTLAAGHQVKPHDNSGGPWFPVKELHGAAAREAVAPNNLARERPTYRIHANTITAEQLSIIPGRFNASRVEIEACDDRKQIGLNGQVEFLGPRRISARERAQLNTQEQARPIAQGQV